MSLIAEAVLLIIMLISVYLTNGIKTQRVIYIPAGGSFEIISYLDKGGYSVTFVDSFLLKIMGKPQKGWIDLRATSLSKGDFLYRLTTAKAALIEIKLIPGETLYFFFKSIEQQLSLSFKKLNEIYAKNAPLSDGFIVPDSYYIPYGIDEERLVRYLVNNAREHHKKLCIKFLGLYDENQWFKYLTIASIIQKEAANTDEMPLVASVIYNRLKASMPLQMDGSLNYGANSHNKVTPQMIDADSTPFNTYKNRGLPPYPVGSMSFDAIKAAVMPAKSDYLYFVRNKSGVHSFSKSYGGHLDNIKQ